MSVIKAIEFPEKEFNTKQELFKHLRENCSDIIDCKKAEVRDSDGIKFTNAQKDDFTAKSVDVEGFEKGFVYPVINTTNYVDSHNDLHIKGIWDKSVKDQQGKVHYVSDHTMKVENIIAHAKHVQMFTKEFNFKELGYDVDMKTEALMFKVDIKDIRNESAKGIIMEKLDIQHSVRMQYVSIDLAIDSDDNEDKEFKKNYDNYIGQVANQNYVKDMGYFWVVTEAKVFREGSMVMLGSNNITPMTFAKEIEPLDDTQVKEGEPLDCTQKNKAQSKEPSAIIEFYKNLK